MDLEAVLTQAINRLEAVLAGESMALRAGNHGGLGEMSNRKNQSLMELSRISRGLDSQSLSSETHGRLSGLRDRLADNSRLLQLHMEATAEVAGMITLAIAEAESDGTYTSSVGGVKSTR